ncbi:MAG TPA: GTPase ObgE [Candidatus Hydrogenedentes bacterium]|nr:GTPase ObgE [Candidatus Hydrogenedentota bacterium]
MFVDRAKITVTGGRGGDGCCSFRREKYVPRGGPDGGDGGNGGDVYIVANSRYASLLDLRFHPHWKGKRGGHGQGSCRHGKNAPPVEIHVPLGTLIRASDTDAAMGDLTEEGQRFLAAQGGRGGKGNARFATATNRAPRFAELGEPGEEAGYVLELKLIAEVGLVGLPNAGKSPFLSRVSAATPKIADYPFTTVSPNLGVAALSDHRTLNIADIPGLIEGAAAGKGLGHEFLRHIERTKVLLFIIDLGDEAPAHSREVLNRELELHNPELATRPKVFALNKADIPENRARFHTVAPQFNNPFLISAATGDGVADVLEHLWAIVDRLRGEEAIPPGAAAERDYTYTPPYMIEKTPQGFSITGKTAVRAVNMTDFNNEEAVRRLQDKLRLMGVFKALKRMGAQQGQTITIGDVELEYQAD